MEENFQLEIISPDKVIFSGCIVYLARNIDIWIISGGCTNNPNNV